MRTVRVVEEVEGSLGRIWRLIEKTDGHAGDKGIIIDTYCPWNGDERPEWMADGKTGEAE